MDLRDSNIKETVRSYLKGSLSALDDFKKETESYIYFFPRMAYRMNPDICSEFYLYVLDRLETIIRNYPLEEDLKFKTWFNYVLKNQYANFVQYRKRREIKTIGIDDFAEVLAVEVFETSASETEPVSQGVNTLPEADRMAIKWFYMPETLTAEDMQLSEKVFVLPLPQLLILQKKLIEARNEEVLEIRQLSEKLAGIDVGLQKLRVILFKRRGDRDDSALKEQNELMVKIARGDEAKARLLRKLHRPNRKTAVEFAALFRNSLRARQCLETAKKRLRAEILRANCLAQS